MLALHPPVEAPIVRPFAYAGSPFARGLHRGVDLAAAPGTAVTAPCAGRVVYAGAHAVTLRCGARRVTLLPLGGVRIRAGRAVPAGTVLARVGPRGAHVGLHLGVRRAGDPFGYEDPAPLLRRRAGVPLGPAPAPGVRRTPRPPADARAPRVTAAPGPVIPAPAPAPGPAPLAAWAGCALAALAAAGGARVRLGRRRRTDPSRARRVTSG